MANLVHVVLLVGGLRLGVRDIASNELAELRHAVLLAAAGEDGLRLILLRVVTSPGLENGVLESAGIGEGHVPGVGLLVHGVEVESGVKLGEAAREEHDAGSGGGNAGLEHLDGGRGNLLGGVALGAVGAGANHGGLEEHAVEHDALVRKVLEGLSPDVGGNLEGTVNVVVTVEENLRLDDGDETSVLADRGVAGEAVRAVGHGGLGGAVGDGDNGAPLAEAGALLVVGSGAVSKVIEALAPGLVGVGKGPEALSDGAEGRIYEGAIASASEREYPGESSMEQNVELRKNMPHCGMVHDADTFAVVHGKADIRAHSPCRP